MPRWARACRAAEVQEGEPLGVKLGGLSIGLFRVDGRLLAIHDICSHEYALLSSGWQEGAVVECPLHQARFDLATGKCLGPPAERDLAVFDLRVEGDDIEVLLPEGETDQTLTRRVG
jgi:3-phenylpropionate/trans-cinnamate dioxygenase ferredoxin component